MLFAVFQNSISTVIQINENVGGNTRIVFSLKFTEYSMSVYYL